MTPPQLLAQHSAADVSAAQSEHYRMDDKIRAMMSGMSLEQKQQLADHIAKTYPEASK